MFIDRKRHVDYRAKKHYRIIVDCDLCHTFPDGVVYIIMNGRKHNLNNIMVCCIVFNSPLYNTSRITVKYVYKNTNRSETIIL